MRIVVTTDCFLPRWDGIARFLSLLLPELAKDARVTVFAPNFGPVPVISGVHVVRFPLMKIQFGDIFFCHPDKAAMKQAIERADLVFNQTIGPVGQLGIKLGYKLGKPVISYTHSVEWELASRAMKRWKWLAGRVVRWIAKRLYNKCSLLLVPSHEVADLLSNIGVRTRKEVVRMGVDTHDFVPPSSKQAAKSKLNIPVDVKVIGFCGRIAREKDLPTLFKAYRRVKKNYDNLVLLIVGSGLSKELPPAANVRYVGQKNNVIPYLQAMDIFALPSLTETSSLATMEAMSIGLPVVVTPVGSIREYVVDRKNGLFFARRDASGLAEKLEYLLKHPGERERLGKEARETIVKSYSWAETAKKIRKIISTF